MVHVERIGPDDIEDVVDLGAEMHAAGTWAKYDYDPTVCRALLWNCVRTPGVFFCAIARRNGEPVGFFLALKSVLFINNAPLACEQSFYVTPDARGGRAALLLYKAFEDWAREVGAGIADVGVSVGINDESALRFYRKMGYAPIGTVLRKDLD